LDLLALWLTMRLAIIAPAGARRQNALIVLVDPSDVASVQLVEMARARNLRMGTWERHGSGSIAAAVLQLSNRSKRRLCADAPVPQPITRPRSAGQDRHQFRLIVAPGGGPELSNLRCFTRQNRSVCGLLPDCVRSISGRHD